MRHPDQTLDQVYLLYRLQDAGEAPPKLQQLRRRLPVGSVIDTGRAYIRFFQQVEDQAWVEMCLMHCRNTRELHIISEQPYCIHSREKNAEAILDPPLHLPPYEHGHIWGLGRDVVPLGNVGIQRQGRP